jgi:phenylalanyl-tRNA synthetase alpha subunit
MPSLLPLYVRFQLGQEFAETGVFIPKKYFSIDRVFRNETTDATHLAEFHQVEFFVADYALTLGHLISLLETFFHRIGVDALRFKPAYNPYTEPSMEVRACVRLQTNSMLQAGVASLAADRHHRQAPQTHGAPTMR